MAKHRTAIMGLGVRGKTHLKAMLENPDKLRGMIHRTGAAPTDFVAKESVEELCAKCDDFAYEWAPVAEEIWNTTPHPKTHTQYYRDGGKARIQ